MSEKEFKTDAESFMRLFRFLTPLLLTIILFVLGHILSQIDKLRSEVAESRKFSVQYTDKMIELILKMDPKKK